MKVKYYINEEKRTITAVLTLEDAERYEVVSYVWDTDLFNLVDTTKLRLHHTYVGMATCLPEDTWDTEYGKTIARRKAYGKYLMARAKKVGQITTAIDKAWNQAINKELELWNKASEYSNKTDHLAGFYD